MGGYEERIDWLVLAIAAIERQCPRTQVSLADVAVALIDREPWLVDPIEQEREPEILLWSHPEDIVGGQQAIEASLSMLGRGIELSLDGVKLAAMMAARRGFAEALLERIESATGRRFPTPPHGVDRTMLRMLLVTCLEAAQRALRPLYRDAGREIHGQGKVVPAEDEKDNHRVFLGLVSAGRSFLERTPDADEAALHAHLRAKLKSSDELNKFLEKSVKSIWAKMREQLSPRQREQMDLQDHIQQMLGARAPAERLPAEIETDLDERFLMSVTIQVEAANPDHRAEELAAALCAALDRREALKRRVETLGSRAKIQLLLHHFEMSLGTFDELEVALEALEAAPPPATNVEPRHDVFMPRRRCLSLFGGAVDDHLKMNLEALKLWTVIGPPESYRKELIRFAGGVLTDRKVKDPEIRTKYLTMARTSYGDALGMTDRESEPTLWATLWHNLGRLEIAAHRLAPTGSHLAAAGRALDRAEEVFRPEADPWAYAAMHVARAELAAASAASG